MRERLALLPVFLLSVTHSASAANYLSFLSLESYYTVGSGDNTYNSVYSTVSFPFGYSNERTVYVSTNSYFSVGAIPIASSLSKFSSSRSYSVVAPFAADIDTTHTGSVRYQTFSTGDSNINTVSSYIRSELGVAFSGRWMLVAEWNNVPQYGGSTSTTNTFQGVIITDGSTSYAVFLYYCPSMEWSGNAIIGWQASSSYYRNHPLSGSSNAKQVACLNTATGSYNTVIFKLSSVIICTSSYSFGCFDGDCKYSARCDGDSDCSDGSDEMACSFSCRSDEFECDNGQCGPESYRCDGYDDCGDNSDEEGCVNYGLALFVSVVVLTCLLCACYSTCLCVVICVAVKKRSNRSFSKNQVTPAPVTQSVDPTAFKAGSQAIPPLNFGGYHTARPDSVPQPTTSSASPPAVISNNYPEPPPYGEQPQQYSK